MSDRGTLTNIVIHFQGRLMCFFLLLVVDIKWMTETHRLCMVCSSFTLKFKRTEISKCFFLVVPDDRNDNLLTEKGLLRVMVLRLNHFFVKLLIE